MRIIGKDRLPGASYVHVEGSFAQIWDVIAAIRCHPTWSQAHVNAAVIMIQTVIDPDIDNVRDRCGIISN